MAIREIGFEEMAFEKLDFGKRDIQENGFWKIGIRKMDFRGKKMRKKGFREIGFGILGSYPIVFLMIISAFSSPFSPKIKRKLKKVEKERYTWKPRVL